MSQLVYSGKSALIQDFILKTEPVFLRTDAHELNCYFVKVPFHNQFWVESHDGGF